MINYKEENSHLADASLSEWSKLISPVLPQAMHWEGHKITSLGFGPKPCKLNVIMKKYPKILNWRTHFKITGQYSSKVSQLLKDFNSLQNYHRLDRIRETWQPNATWDTRATIKTILVEKNSEIQIKSVVLLILKKKKRKKKNLSLL